MDFAALITDLKAKLATANQRLGKLAEQRRPHALDAVTGSARAKKAIEKIDTQAAATRSEAETLATAIEEAAKQKAEHEARLAVEDRRRREATRNKRGNLGRGSGVRPARRACISVP